MRYLLLMLTLPWMLLQAQQPIDIDLLGEDVATCADSMVIHAPWVQGAHYAWSTGDTTPRITVQTEGQYGLVMTLPDGTVQRDWIWVTMYFKRFPNVLSYNCGYRGNFDPECLRFDTPHPEAYSLVVFDRWGNLIFETKDPKEGWCPYEAEPRVPVGVYFYRMESLHCDGSAVELQSDITFIR